MPRPCSWPNPFNDHQTMQFSMNKTVAEKADLLRVVVAAKEKGVLFPELALTLLVFVDELYEEFSRRDVEDALFLSREGYVLKQLFESYVSVRQPENVIRTHYLEASRRSTFLLSLRDLAVENFHVLFRQYVRISVQDFLRSLDLQAYAEELAAGLGVKSSAFSLTSDHLPSDPLFIRLIESEAFGKIYESERARRSAAFKDYVAGLFSGQLPDELHLVDVGWKGSIQDNIHNWFIQQNETGTVSGYYIGLVAPGLRSDANFKDGLLFNSLGGMTEGFRIFNENRSLFEVFLPAPHGSPVAYRKGPEGGIEIVHDEFSERAFIERHVQKATDQIVVVFKQLLDVLGTRVLEDGCLRSFAIQQHARMVYDPTETELTWILAAEHAESFGVFSTSTFAAHARDKNLLERSRFTIRLMRDRRLPDAHWPWFELRRSGLPGLSRAYALFRLVQERLGRRSAQ